MEPPKNFFPIFFWKYLSSEQFNYPLVVHDGSWYDFHGSCVIHLFIFFVYLFIFLFIYLFIYFYVILAQI